MSDTGVVWAPVPKRRIVRQSEWPGRLQPFVEHPGEEGMIDREFSPNTISNLAGSLRKRQDLPGDGSWQFFARVRHEDGKRVGRLWVKYTPKPRRGS